jgi:methyl-accepting chemotaxis protein
VPGAKSWVKGLANVRGHLLAVIDLRQFLGGSATVMTRNTRILVVNHRDIPAGLVVDEVLGFRRFAENEFSGDAPQTLAQCDRYLAGAFAAAASSGRCSELRLMLESANFHGGRRLTRTFDAWVAAAIILMLAAAGCLPAGARRAAELCAVVVGAARAGRRSSSLALIVVAVGVREQRLAANQQRLAVDAQRAENDRSQQAILRLLDELSSLADGDLTVQATVTEDITGAIADSINYAVEALRGLVITINHSSMQVDGATRQTQALAQHLAKASGAQSKQIASATESAGGMASSTEEVSGNAERAADVARHSVEVAHKGGDAVRRTIDGMNAIRETIQETSKRIKRLGESSQEIGNIVELINDIAEQTNILALNASIQASMAGRGRTRLRGGRG